MLTASDNIDAFEVLYDRYHGLVDRVSRYFLDDAAAEDVTQGVFLSIWKSPLAFRGGSFGAWLTRVTQNRVRDVLRNYRARRESPWPPNLNFIESVDDVVFSRLEIIRMRSALTALPVAQRMLIELGFLGEHTHAEIAAMTDLPLGTVKTRIRSGLQKLRSSLTTDLRALRADCA